MAPSRTAAAVALRLGTQRQTPSWCRLTTVSPTSCRRPDGTERDREVFDTAELQNPDTRLRVDVVNVTDVFQSSIVEKQLNKANEQQQQHCCCFSGCLKPLKTTLSLKLNSNSVCRKQNETRSQLDSFLFVHCCCSLQCCRVVVLLCCRVVESSCCRRVAVKRPQFVQRDTETRRRPLKVVSGQRSGSTLTSQSLQFLLEILQTASFCQSEVTSSRISN